MCICFCVCLPLQMQETVLLLAALAESCVGQPFCLSHLTAAQRRLLDLCVDLGIAYIPSQSSKKASSDKASQSAFAFAAPYALLIRRDAHSLRLPAGGPQGPPGPSTALAPSGAFAEFDRTTIDDTRGAPVPDAASVMEGPFHPWVPEGKK